MRLCLFMIGFSVKHFEEELKARRDAARVAIVVLHLDSMDGIRDRV